MRVSITGASGFIGSRLAQICLGRDIPVQALSHRRPEPRDDQPPAQPGVERVAVELRDAPSLAGVFQPGDVVIHAAAMISPADPQAQEQVNVDGTRAVIEACRRSGVSRLIHVSSTAAIGISPDPHNPADERFRFNLDELGLSYNNTKRRAEELVRQANDAHLTTVVVNPGVVLGEHGGRYRGGEIISRVLRSRLIPCTAGGLSMVHVDDVADGILAAIDLGRGGERYILSGENLTFQAIARTVCRVTGVKKPIVPVPDAVRDLAYRVSRLRGTPNHIMDRRYAHQFYSADKARRELSFEPRSFEAIVADFLSVVRRLRNR